MTRQLRLFWIGLGICCLCLIVYVIVLRKPPTPSKSGTQVVDRGKDSQEQVRHQLPSLQVEGAMSESPGDSPHSHSVLENYETSHSTADIVFGVRPDEEQIAAYRQELEENPDSFEALSELGYWLAKSEPLEAIGYLKRVIQIDPKNAEAYRSLVRAYDALDQWEGKFAVFDKARELGIKLYPGVTVSLPKEWRETSREEKNGQGDSPLSPDHITERHESGFDEPHGESQSPRSHTGPTDAEQQAFDELIRQLEEYQQMTLQEMAEFDQQIENWLRAIESNYEVKGNMDKADEIYKQVEGRFPSNKQGREAREAFMKRREQMQRERPEPKRRGERTEPSGRSEPKRE